VSELKAELRKLYSDASKHSVYQNIPDFVSSELGYTETIDETWRGDRPRLAYLIESRTPISGEKWIDFGANTGFFTLSLARQFPQVMFTAVEANPNHARFIALVARYFELSNVDVIQRAIGLEDLDKLPQSDFLLHLNVLHHAGHDFDAALVIDINAFDNYAHRYLESLRERTRSLFFQMGSNWGGDKTQPLVEMRDDFRKLETFAAWLRKTGWRLDSVAYPSHDDSGRVRYDNLASDACQMLGEENQSRHVVQAALEGFDLDRFPGEFYRRPLFLCEAD
jgi:hypothetical protein